MRPKGGLITMRGLALVACVAALAACLPRPKREPPPPQPAPIVFPPYPPPYYPPPQPQPPPVAQPSPEPSPSRPATVDVETSRPAAVAIETTRPAPSPPAEEPEPLRTWTQSEPVRLIASLGTAGTASVDELEPSIGIGTRSSWRVSEFFTIGIRNHILLHNWSETGRFYDYIMECEKIDTRCDKRADYWAIGWAIAIATAELGWDVMIRREGPSAPWVSFGTAAVLYQTGKGFGEDGPVDFQFGHAGTVGIGYDFDAVGIGLRTSAASDLVLFGSTGDPILSVQASIDILLPRSHPDRKRRR